MQKHLGGLSIKQIGVSRFRPQNPFLNLRHNYNFCSLDELAKVCGMTIPELLQRYGHLSETEGAMEIIYTNEFDETFVVESMEIGKISDEVSRYPKCRYYCPEKFALYVQNVHFNLEELAEEIDLMLTIRAAIGSIKTDAVFQKKLERAEYYTAWIFISELQRAIEETGLAFELNVEHSSGSQIWKIEAYYRFS